MTAAATPGAGRSRLRVLVVEDSPDDAELCLRELRRAGLDPRHRRVQQAAAFEAALDEETWDVVLCDYTMPSFSGSEALAILRSRDFDTPFIYVSGTIGEETAVAAMREGAQDYVVKTNLRRLAPAVDRALRDVAIRREHSKAEAERQAAERRFREVLAMAPDAIVTTDEDLRITIFNRAAEEMFGVAREKALGRSIEDLVPGLFTDAPVPDLRDQPWFSGVAAPLAIRREITGRRRTGEAFATEASISQLVEDGRLIHMAVIRDVSARQALEQRLRHAHKMEAVGQLTGGIAHDFNNLLTAILGNLELVLDEVGVGPEAEELVRNAYEAGHRGAELIRHLLVFSRRQELTPKVVDLNELIGSTAGFLRRTLGEQIAVSLRPEPGLWPTLADPGQIASAIANLAINARDAMPDGGSLVIATANRSVGFADATAGTGLAPGDYVQLVVADTGVGMNAETLSRAFDPFFTTKGEGVGTGLGLSMIYGLAKESGGNVEIDSKPGRGTTVRLHLPRAYGQVPAASPPRPAPRAPGKASILVVEDDGHVRRAVVRTLVKLGYQVSEARDGPSALKLIESGAAIDLLFTDIVMPNGMLGPQLARRALARRPGLRALFTSGNPVIAGASLDEIREMGALLRKPWSVSELAEAIQGALPAQPS
jgi:two-component system, cell cycle sensor histidine kinase and response regulator CckA